MFERFTDGSRRAVVLAQESARELHHRTITTEHLLLGVAAAHQGAGAVALADLGATPAGLRDAVLKVVPADPAAPGGDTGHVPFTRAAKQALEHSLHEALSRDAEMIDNGHILLALLRRTGDQLPSVLAAAGIEGSALRPAVERRLAELVGGFRGGEGARDSPDGPPADHGRLDRIEGLLTEVLDRLDRIEARLEHPEAH